jgi:hypothetical protein
VDISSAREFAGWSSVAVVGGALFVGDGEAPQVTRYAVTDDGQFGDQGPTLSFAQFGLSTGSLSFNTFVDETAAHMSLEQTTRIVWDPTLMEIVDAVESPEIPRERDGLSVTAANFQGRVVRDDGVIQPFFWHDADWYEFHQQSQVAFYSRTGELEAQLDVPCPALQIATKDEAGNLYLSGMVDTIRYQLAEAGSTLERCVARIDAGTRELADGWPRAFEELTDGRPAGTFHYVADGVGILSVYHVENVDPTSATFVDDWSKDNWGLWLVDLEAWEAAPIQDWELGSSNVFFSKVDGRLFLHRVAADFTKTTIFEIKPDGSITEQITMPGYAAYEIIRVR